MLSRLRLSRWLGDRDGQARADAVKLTPPLASQERRGAILDAKEVILVLGDRLPAEVEEWLSERTQPSTVNVLCPGDFPDAEYLLELAERDYQLFDAFVHGETLLFLDRKRGYRLPSWEGVAGAFSLACALMWKRWGSYCRPVGTVSELPPGSRLFKLWVSERLWMWVMWPRDHEMPLFGSRVKVLGIDSWLGQSITSLVRGVLVVDLATTASHSVAIASVESET